jgi:[CysO sulfur-carrier protein]-S-L-cysteine hydrolase
MSEGDATGPWVAGPLRIRRAVLESIRAHGEAEFPKESCGWLSGPIEPWDLLDEASRGVNEADRYHALDPEQFPRTSRDYFRLSNKDFDRARRAGAAASRPVKVVYHSHCDSQRDGFPAGDYFSGEDSETFAREGHLWIPCAFVVVGVVGGRALGQRLWTHRPNTNEFDERELLVID